MVGSKWPSLATCLSLSASAIEEVREEGSSEQHHVLALRMLTKWVLREDATYGQLYQTLTTPSLLAAWQIASVCKWNTVSLFM